ncbi:MAG: D-alanyl-D-alanine carboxypeptidase family protein [Pseudomonadota bacterium]
MRPYFLACLLALLLAPFAAESRAAAPIVPKAPEIAATAYILLDAGSGRVLAERDADSSVPPASLTKIMTSYVAATELAAGRIRDDDMVSISVRAWRMGGSKMFVREGTQVPLIDLLRGVIIQSGNDASVALAEHVAGDEGAFADMMNEQAARLGMTSTSFRNATGLPDDEHYASARDLAALTEAMIRDFPDHYSLYSERSFRFNGIDQPNRNRLLWRDKTVDGVKTGHTRAAGYCLVASAERNGQRLISVVLGTASDEARMRESQKLLSYGFRYFETRKIYDADVMLRNAQLWFGEQDTVELGLAENMVVTIPRGSYDMVKAEMRLPDVIEAPLAAGTEVGELRLSLDDEIVARAPLVALEDAEEAGLFKWLWQSVVRFFQDLISG